MMKINEYLGKHVSNMLQKAPFKNWTVERSTEDDLDEQIVHYVFPGYGLELRCDLNDKISVKDLFEIPFSLNRANVIKHYGRPSKSGGKISDPILGEYGAWDRFLRSGYAIHVEYWYNADRIKRITLIRSDVIPE
jgi:hypothetical protein